LGEFEFLAFGKAINSERPLILRREFDQEKLDASQALHKPLAEEAPAEGKVGVVEHPDAPAIADG